MKILFYKLHRILCIGVCVFPTFSFAHPGQQNIGQQDNGANETVLRHRKPYQVEAEVWKETLPTEDTIENKEYKETDLLLEKSQEQMKAREVSKKQLEDEIIAKAYGHIIEVVKDELKGISNLRCKYNLEEDFKRIREAFESDNPSSFKMVVHNKFGIYNPDTINDIRQACQILKNRAPLPNVY